MARPDSRTGSIGSQNGTRQPLQESEPEGEIRQIHDDALEPSGFAIDRFRPPGCEASRLAALAPMLCQEEQSDVEGADDDPLQKLDFARHSSEPDAESASALLGCQVEWPAAASRAFLPAE